MTTSAVLMNSSMGEWFKTAVGVNISLERIMSDALEEHYGKVNIGGRNIPNLRFADDKDVPSKDALAESLDKTCTG